MHVIISTSSAPAAVGPYAQAVAVGGMVFLSGQLPIDPETGDFPPGGVQAQARQCLENIKAVLQKSGLSMDHIVKTTVFLQDMKDFSAMNEVYASYFSQGHFPARSAVQVAALPKQALIEIEAVAM